MRKTLPKTICKRCGMLLTSEWAHRRSQVKRGMCDSCGGDEWNEDEERFAYNMSMEGSVGR